MYFQAYRMHRERLAAWLCTPQVSGYSFKGCDQGRERRKGRGRKVGDREDAG